MRKFLALAVLLFTPFMMNAGQYLGVKGGSDYCHRTDANDHGQKVGYVVGGFYGYKFANDVRGEVEISYRDGHKRTTYVYSDGGDDQKTHASNHSMSYMANALYDVAQISTYGVTPFVGAGLGLCSNTYELKTQKGDFTNRDKGKDDRFAYQIIAGAKYSIAENMELAAQYNYFVGMMHAKNHSFSLALIRGF